MTRLLALILVGLGLLFAAGCGGSGTCSPSTCNGCCDSKGQCQLGGTPTACGGHGGVCEVCPGNDICQNDVCVPNTQNPDGGSACAASCNGCCEADGGCTGGTTTAACGQGGVNCQACSGAQMCTTLGCDDTTCSGCVDSTGACQPGNTNTSCGASGFSCKACTGGSSCNGGQCTGGQCFGCVDAFGACQPGNAHGACGQGGATCASCTSDQVCGAGGCQLADAGSCTSNGNTCAGNDACCSAYCDTTGHCGVKPACLPSCPPGYSCTAGGVCSGGDDQSIVLNVLTPQMVTVSGVVQHNGAAPVDCTSGDAAQIYFTNLQDQNYSANTLVQCGQAFQFTQQLAAGTYDITVDGSYNSQVTGLPNWQVTVQHGVAINGNSSDTLNVVTPPMVTVSGVVQHNGASPVDCTSGDAAQIYFTNTQDQNYSANALVQCGQAFQFTQQLAAGTYDITVDGSYNSQVTGLPNWQVTVQHGVAINGNSSDTLNVVTPPMVTVSGVVQHNGASPVDCTSGDAAQIYFTNTQDQNYSANALVQCGQAFQFTQQLAAGTYDITVDGSYNSQVTGLPNWQVTVQKGVAINGNSSDTLNVVTPPMVTVSGVVQHNGASPVDCTSGDAAQIYFTNDNDPNYSANTLVQCGQAFQFTQQLAAGTYDITVDGSYNSQVTGLPNWQVTVQKGVAINGNSSDTLNVVTPPVVTLSGVVQLNGAAPTDCTSGDSVQIYFTNDNDPNYSANTLVQCGQAFQFTQQLAAGKYDITVDGSYNSQVTGLPNWQVPVQSGVAINGNSSDTLNVVTPPMNTIAGVVQHNGAAPVDCTTGDAVQIYFTNTQNQNYSANLLVQCGAGFIFNGSLASGTYEVSVDGSYNSQVTGLPNWNQLVVSELKVP